MLRNEYKQAKQNVIFKINEIYFKVYYTTNIWIFFHMFFKLFSHETTIKNNNLITWSR